MTLSEGLFLNYRCVEETAGRFGADVLKDEKLADYTSFNIGGKCSLLVKANCAECVAELVSVCRKNNIKYYILGKGSNLLISDNGLDAVVILLSGDFGNIRTDGTRLICDAGAAMYRVCTEAREVSLTGMEFAYGIPGTVGGGLYMNAGAYGGEMKDVVEYCDYLDEHGDIRRMYKDEMKLSYRHSAFSENGYIILSVCFLLSEGDKNSIDERMKELMNKRREKQPLEYPSAGSTFKRPEGYFAAKLIEDSGLKGFTVGGAKVSEKHSGFVINIGGASFGDVYELTEQVKKKVYADSGVMLEREVIIWE